MSTVLRARGGSAQPVEEILRSIEAVTHDDVRAVAADVLARPRGLAVVGPFDDSDAFTSVIT